MGIYAAKSKLQDDLEREIKDLREFDFNSEQLKDVATGSKKAIVLAKYTQPETEQQPEGAEAQKEVLDKVLLQRDLLFFNDIAPARLFSTSIRRDEEFKMVFEDQATNKDTPLEIHFPAKHKCMFFDIDTLKL